MNKYNSLHTFNMFDRIYAFDFNTKFVFSLDELSLKILNGELLENDYVRFDKNLIEKRVGLINLLRSKGILSAENLSKTEVQRYEPSLTSINLFLTNNCNLRCKYCFEESNYKAFDIDKEIIKKSIDFLHRNKEKTKTPTIYFFGGEPLLKVELINFINEYINNNKKSFEFNFGITTNGTILNDDIYKLLTNMNVNIMLSLDGSEYQQNLNRKFASGKGSYNTVKENIKTYLQNDLDKISVRNTITKSDIKYLETYRYFKKNKFKSLISVPVSTNSLNDKLSKNNVDVIIKNSVKIVEEALDDILNGNETLMVSFFYQSKLYPINETNSYCGAGIKSVAIDTNGDIYVCHRFVNNKKFQIGNVFDNDIDDKLMFNQNLYRSRYKQLEKCSECWALSLCKGGCMHENLMEGGDINHTDHTLCELRKAWHEISIAMYAILCEKKPKMIKHLYGDYIFENYMNRWIPLNVQ